MFFQNLKDEREAKRRKHVEDLEDKVLLAEAVKAFFAGEIGKHVQEQMNTDLKGLEKDLMDIPPWKVKQIMRVQSQHQAITRLKTYLGKALLAGDNAYQELKQLNNRD